MFRIYDWAGNLCFTNESFDTFEDGWEFIYENVNDESYYDEFYVLADNQNTGE